MLKEPGELLESKYVTWLETLPVKLRGNLVFSESSQAQPLDHEFSSLGPNELLHELRQERTNERRERIVKVDTLSRDPFVGERLTPQGQVAIITEEFGPDLHLSPDALLIEGSEEDLGFGFSWLTEARVPDVFREDEFGLQRPTEVTPIEFRALLPDEVESYVIEGIATAPMGLLAGELEVREQQLTEFKKRVSRRSRPALGYPYTLTEFETSNEKQRVERNKKLLLGLDNLSAVPTALRDVHVKNLGDGSFVEITEDVPSLFTAAEFTKQISDIFPERFTAGNPILQTALRSIGTAASPSLASTDIRKSEKQLNAFVKESLAISRASATFPTLHGQDYERSTDLIFPYDEDILPTAGEVGDAHKSVQPIGLGFGIIKTPDVAAAEANMEAYMFEFAGTRDLDLPNELLSVVCTMERSSGMGVYDTTDYFGIWIDHGSYSVSDRGTAQGSVALTPSVRPIVRENPAKNTPTKHYLFYLPSPITLADIITKCGLDGPWPIFKPKSASVTAVGRKASLQVTADAQYHNAGDATGSSEAGSSGEGSSREIGMVVSTTHISPTIHGNVPISGDDFDSESVNISTIVAIGSLVGSVSEYAEVEAHVISDGLDDTDGETAIPNSGEFLLHADCEPFMLGWGRVHAESVDFAYV